LKNILKRSFYIFAGLPLIHYFGRPWRGRACVLCYHRVLPDDEFEADKNLNSDLIMPVSKFEEQMRYLSETHEVVTMDELVEHIESDSTEFVIAITFDDGYKDNLVHALPVLEKYNIPAMIYITTRFPEGDTWMWWYEIWDYLVENDSLLVGDILKGRSIKTNKQKNKSFKILLNLILNKTYGEQITIVEKFTRTADRKQYPQLCLSWEEIIKLDRHPLITIGAHTHSHPNLKQLPEEEAYSEMMLSKNKLEEQLGHSVDHFSYPFGTVNDAGVREFKLASNCGFKTAVTARPDTLHKPLLHAIPRLGVSSYLNLQGFIGKLSGLENLVRKI
jgi:peptidoglycan/xylan/chitin deacetylase (PgdA/CDA1 family)